MITAENHGPVLLVAIVAPHVSAENCRDLSAQLLETTREARYVLLDMQAVQSLDSSGLSMLITLLRRLNERQGQLKLCQARPRILTLLNLVRMSQIFPNFGTREEGLAAFPNEPGVDLEMPSEG